MQARWGRHGDHQIIALAPFSVEETYVLTVRAFNLAERYRTPVVLLLDEIIGHVNEKVSNPEAHQLTVLNRKRSDVDKESYLPYLQTEDKVPPMADFGSGYRFHVTGLAHDQTGFPTNDSAEISKLMSRLEAKITDHIDDIVETEEMELEDAVIGVLAYGSTARSARHAVRTARSKGLKAGLLRLKTLWPFPEMAVRQWSSRIKVWIVPEMNLGQMAHEVEWAAAGRVPVVRLNRVDGEPLSPVQILDVIEENANV